MDIVSRYQRRSFLLAVGLLAGGCGGNTAANPTQRQGGSPDAAPQVGTDGPDAAPQVGTEGSDASHEAEMDGSLPSDASDGSSGSDDVSTTPMDASGSDSSSAAVSDPPDASDGSAPVPDSGVISPESDAGSAATLREAALARCEDGLSGACASEELVLSELRFDDESEDELLSPGEEATVMVTLQNASLSEASGHCLGLVADAELVILASQNVSDVAWACAFDAVPPGETATFSWQVQVDALAQVGSSVHLLAYVSMGQTECACSDSPWLYRTITIG